MPQTYKIESVGQPSEWENQPSKKDYPVGLAGDGREVWVFYDASKTKNDGSPWPPPQVGDEVYGDLEQDNRGRWKLRRKAKPRDGSAASGGSQGASDGKFDRRPEHPRNEARMVYSGAFANTPTYINQMVAFGLVNPPGDTKAYWELVGEVAGKLVRAHFRALEEPDPPKQQEVPADTTGLPV